MPDIFQLSENFRTHMGIVQCAGSVVCPIYTLQWTTLICTCIFAMSHTYSTIMSAPSDN